jgi:hypothetical protein
LDTPEPKSPVDWEPSGPIDAPQDLRGCFVTIFRCGGCMAILYIIMFIAVVSAALLSLLFFR